MPDKPSSQISANMIMEEDESLSITGGMKYLVDDKCRRRNKYSLSDISG
jgi:hypothetical protein